MSKLDDLVQKFIQQNEEERSTLNHLEDTQRELIDKQEAKIRETALKSIPAMEIISSNHYRFKGKDTSYVSSRGPILKHDKSNNQLFIFSVEDKCPITVNLYDNEVKRTTYRKLLENVEFENIMESLLMVLNFTDDIKADYQKSNNSLEMELKKYDDI